MTQPPFVNKHSLHMRRACHLTHILDIALLFDQTWGRHSISISSEVGLSNTSINFSYTCRYALARPS
jgi:hypothetical protein